MANRQVAVIGGGNMGRHHARVYHEIDAVDLVAVVDPSPQAQPLADRLGVERLDSVQSLLSAYPALHAASIATPTAHHYRAAADLLTAGVHVLVEKPFTATPHEADLLIDLSRKPDSPVLTVGHIERFNPVVRGVKDLIDSGALGTVSSIICRRIGGLPNTAPPSDVILDLAIHDLDLLTYLTGQPAEVLSAHASRTYHPLHHDSGEVLARCGSASGFIQANWVSPVKIRTLTVTGSHGMAEANYLTQELTLHDSPRLRDLADRADIPFEEFVAALGAPETTSVPVNKTEPLRAELDAFLTAADSGDRSGIMSPEQARHALLVAAAASSLATASATSALARNYPG